MPKSEDREEFSLAHRPSTITHTTAMLSTNPNAFLSSTTRNAMMNGIIFSGPLAAVTMGCFLASQNLGRKLTNTEMLTAFIVLLLLTYSAFGAPCYRGIDNSAQNQSLTRLR